MAKTQKVKSMVPEEKTEKPSGQPARKQEKRESLIRILTADIPGSKLACLEGWKRFVIRSLPVGGYFYIASALFGRALILYAKIAEIV